MITGIITTNEPKSIKKLFEMPSMLELPLDFDMKLLTNAGNVGIERKKVPSDLLSSVADGRLGREIIAMREECQFKYVLWHGVITYRKDGTVDTGKHRYGQAWTRKGIRNLRRTLEVVEGCYVEYAKTNQELVDIVNEIQDYYDKGKHLSLKGRPGLQSDWIVPTRQEKIRYFYDGLPGIGVVGAKCLTDRFPNPMGLYQASIEMIMETPGIGRHTATEIYNFLRGII